MSALPISLRFPPAGLPVSSPPEARSLAAWINHAREAAMTTLSPASGKVETGGVDAAKLAMALRRRLHPHTSLTIKALAMVLRVSEQTIWAWLNGINQPRWGHVLALINFFDAAFANEILAGTGAVVAKLADARAALAKAEAEHARALAISKIAEAGA